MAASRISPLSEFLKENILPDIKLGKQIGSGASGRILEAEWGNRKVAVKEIHSILIDETNDEELQVVRKNFERECERSLQSIHPNIVRFFGIHFPPGARLPSLVMEHLQGSLTDLLKREPGLVIKTKLSLLVDVTLGLSYLHSYKPPIIHRDLSSNNVLIYNRKGLQLVGKIGDLGACRLVDQRKSSQMTMAPGTIDFMPPEALQPDEIHYGVRLDVFSFGCVMLHTLSHKWPTPTQPVVTDPVTREHKGRSEIERRSSLFDCIVATIDRRKSGVLIPLIKLCLNNLPGDRPSISTVNKQLEDMMDKEADEPKPKLPNSKVPQQPSEGPNEGDESVGNARLRKFGKEGTRQASLRWFKTTQAEAILTERGKVQVWFHGIITRRQAEERLVDKPNGSFLVRVSESQFGYSLSFRVIGRCKHYLIKQVKSKYIVSGEARVHDTLEDLVHYYQKHPINSDGNMLTLACANEDSSTAKEEKPVYAEIAHPSTRKAKVINSDYDNEPGDSMPPLPPRNY